MAALRRRRASTRRDSARGLRECAMYLLDNVEERRVRLETPVLYRDRRRIARRPRGVQLGAGRRHHLDDVRVRDDGHFLDVANETVRRAR